jgi:hypothetical protein
LFIGCPPGLSRIGINKRIIVYAKKGRFFEAAFFTIVEMENQ